MQQPTSLVKFTGPEAGLRILSDSQLRWSAPVLFADPFELNHHSSLNFDSRKLLSSCVKSTMGLIFSRDDPMGSSPLIKAIRRWRSEDRFDNEEEAQEVLSELLTSMVQHREPEMLRLMKDWRDYTRRLRILCLSEKHDENSLWWRYADNHRGIAIRFACGDETSLPRPMAVRYTETKPEITPLSEQMEILMNQTNVEVQKSFPDKFLSKSKADIKEREWRILQQVDGNNLPDNESLWYEEVPFQETEVRAIYFGVATDARLKQDISNLVKRRYPKTKLFQARTQAANFELEFDRIDSNGALLEQ